jgi:hypothetical protein
MGVVWGVEVVMRYVDAVVHPPSATAAAAMPSSAATTATECRTRPPVDPPESFTSLPLIVANLDGPLGSQYNTSFIP